MNAPQRDGAWNQQPGQSPMNVSRPGEQTPRSTGQPPAYGPPSSNQQASTSGPLLPPPGPFHPAPASNAATNLPSIAGMTQPSSGVPPQQRPPMPPQDQNPASAPPPQHVQYQPAGYPLPAINQSVSFQPAHPQSTADRDREIQEARDRGTRERELEQGRREQQRDRDAREQQIRDGPQTTPHQNHAEHVQLHQPVAVGPRMQSAIHGPNGLLNSGGQQQQQQGAANAPSSAPNGSTTMFNPQTQYERNAQANSQAAQLPVQNMMFEPGTPGMQQMAAVPGVAPGQQPILNDALSYLDQVKVQFAGEPQVYNQFLDIMKDFKSQTIDTPGVIRRVSALFQGNPNLIQGFNTFLPPGYRIECGTADDPNEIRVTTPMGTTVSPMGRPIDPPPEPRQNAADTSDAMAGDTYDSSSRDAAGIWSQQRANEHRENILSSANRAQAGPAYNHQLRQGSARLSPFEASPETGGRPNAALLAHQQEQRGVSQLQSAVSAATGEGYHGNAGMSPFPDSSAQVSGTASLQQGTNAEKKGPVEFNHAISYVNKIKNRFSSQPEVYKQFLEILQTYQRESKPIQDVYSQVTQLFGGAPDLLVDFKQFLPESAAQAKAAADKEAAENATMLSDIRGDYSAQRTSQFTPRAEQHRMPPVGNFAPTPSAGRDAKRKRGDRSLPLGAAGAAPAGPDFGGGNKSGFMPAKRGKTTHGQSQKYQPQAEAPHVSPTLVPSLPEPMPPGTSVAATHDELNFFDRVKKYMNNRQHFSEFLKLCNLYSQDLVDKNLLAFRASNFIGNNPELYNWFKDFLGYDGKDHIIENRPRGVTGRVNLNNCRSLGQSYREMPKRERMKPCTGRDETCNAVLNDHWVSHPTWASEDSGFIAHKKNTHEEGLHRVEEERHDYDIHIAVAQRSIEILEPIAQKNNTLKPLEREAWKLLPGHFEGQEQAILKKTFTKIYGRDNALEILNDLHKVPANVVPVVLARCRHIAEIWKQSQREWEKVWRDQTQKMFYRSLDHQGINVRNGEKRQFQTKTLQNEIQAKFEEQKRLRLAGQTSVPRHQLQTIFLDPDAIMDASRLLLIWCEMSSSADLPRLLPFIKEFIPLFFGFPLDKFQRTIEAEFSDAARSHNAEEGTPAPEDPSGPSRGRKMNGKRGGDLLRGVLNNNTRGRSTRADFDGSVDPSSRASTPEVTPRGGSAAAAAAAADEEMVDAAGTEGEVGMEETDEESLPDTWVFHPSEGNAMSRNKREIKPNESFNRNVYNMYANLPIYCFFRVFSILYERLHNLKTSEDRVRETVRRARQPKPATDLKMTDKDPHDFFADTSSSANYYKQMLVILEQFIRDENGVDLAYLEDVLRRFYLSNGWMLYSFDRLMGSLTRFATAVLGGEGAKDRSGEVLGLFFKDRRKERTTHSDEMGYRRLVEKYVREGDVYRIAWNTNTSRATISLLKKDEPTFASHTEDGLLTPDQRWAFYVSAYTSTEPTESVPLDDVALPFPARSLRRAARAADLDAARAARPSLPPKTNTDEAQPDAASDTNPDADAEQQPPPPRPALPPHRDIGDPRSAPPLGSSPRWNRIFHRENLGLKISPDNYRIYWPQPGMGLEEEWWVFLPRPQATRPQRSGGNSGGGGATGEGDGAAEVKQEREGGDGDGEERGDEEDAWHRFEEKFVMNNSWMRGWSRDEVAERNGRFGAWVGVVGEGEGDGDDGGEGAGGDVDMKG